MSRRQPDLMIDGLRLPLHAGAQIQQQYEDFGGFFVRRLGGGAAVHQETWRKTRTTLSAAGLIPPGLDGRDWSQPFVLGCVAPRSKQAASNIFALPVARRADAAPFGFAVDATGLLRPVPVVVAGDTATLGLLAGAVSYQVLWYPLLTVRAPAGVRSYYDAQGAVASWELICEEG
ncbi:hypothetical protein [Thauera humireducens]|uniref:Uncharacterized protein n=1 Tax=Thauera humireducens TaxID=1134435 RepID=A0A127K473_9RHOO|nr:hypothetical protein [Thauera humireducens]AMO36746.1 hypothetical protein AC731_007185 [Thauera humireducens]